MTHTATEHSRVLALIPLGEFTHVGAPRAHGGNVCTLRCDVPLHPGLYVIKRCAAYLKKICTFQEVYAADVLKVGFRDHLYLSDIFVYVLLIVLCSGYGT